MKVVAVQLWLQLDDYEWSERYDLASSLSPFVIAYVMAQTRAFILAQPCKIDRALVWDVASPKTRSLFYLGMQPSYNRLETPPPIPLANTIIPCGDAGVTVNFTVVGEHGHKRVMAFAGIPNQTEVNANHGVTLLPTMRRIVYEPGFAKRVTQFRTKLLGGDVTLMMRERVVEPTTTANVLAIDQGEQGLYRLTIDRPWGLPAGTAVKFDGTRFQNGSHMRGIRRIRLVESPTVFHLDRGPLAERGPVQYLGGGTISQVQYAWTQCSSRQDLSWIDVRPRGGRRPARRGRKWSKVVS